ncbi:2-dehydro-3-deoxygalactonokinase [Psychrosphaera sp. B3R10]|uniref:2-dehydro-3-deoxygalactonokinase n=1 Tax=unclassified Psychrosphaera TaxID=2641570 RepID=UPI001C088D28|nr:MULTISPECIES: 2-dehydro-3-deoxygalactonokinase [unclassified Psychrosphaera]MBU2881218.1 2-dehydro-3-deoxygalactonokinase [Psychrosphaera sp. I2R16]MBU2990061.1 2-dehydro-3-deoxygalactonokinase [Psychrosphaera sp. B3R10]
MEKAREQIHHLIIDWGTTNFRAFAMSDTDQLIETKEAPMGLLQVPNNEFATALEALLNDWLDDYKSLPIYMAGMVGSMKGWVNVDYAHAPVSAPDLVAKAHVFALPWGPQAVIIPGVCYGYRDLLDSRAAEKSSLDIAEVDKYDVMRGEEVQILGLAAQHSQTELTAVLPGTHSKHAHVVDGKLTQFSSYLTGELFDLLTKHSLLGKGLPSDASSDNEAFIKGVDDGQSGEFSNRIFLAWTQRLFNSLNEAQIPDYLSGMLIGMELKKLPQKHIYIVGGKGLSLRYQLAAEHLGKTTTLVAGNDCFLAGMAILIKSIK